jgi:hypothetical protein
MGPRISSPQRYPLEYGAHVYLSETNDPFLTLSLNFSIDLILPAALSRTRNLLGGRPERNADNLTAMC